VKYVGFQNKVPDSIYALRVCMLIDWIKHLETLCRMANAAILRLPLVRIELNIFAFYACNTTIIHKMTFLRYRYDHFFH